MNRSDLTRIINSTASRFSEPERFETGLCGEFAHALQRFLTESGSEAHLVTGLRTEVEDGDPQTSFSHVVVSALGTTWDWKGSDAIERWEESWASCDGTYEFEWCYNARPTDYRDSYGAAKFDMAMSNDVLSKLTKTLCSPKATGRQSRPGSKSLTSR